jgi:hypothetical protein
MGQARRAFLFAMLVAAAASGWAGATQKSVVQGVTIAVTPGVFELDDPIWDFAIAFDGRGQRLDEEMLQVVVLTGDGRTIQPLAWEGAGPGTGHRAGVLKFVAMHPRPKQLELRILRKGEASPRLFRFAFGEWSV